MPKRTALYRLYDADDRLLYVGISVNPKQRFRAHAATKRWWGDVERATSEWFENRGLAFMAEIEAIHAENPLHNVLGTDAFRAQQSATATAISPERRRARSVGCQARAIYVRTLRELRSQGVPEAEAKRQAQLAQQRHKDASGLFPRSSR